MAKCRLCGENADYNTNDGYCILHSPKTDKDKNDFYEALAEHAGPKGGFFYIVFPPNADFSDREFTDASFGQAKFLGKVNFEGATFTGGRANFQSAVFCGKANFDGATFSAEPDFRGARFIREANFPAATFGKGVQFSGITFSEEANFTGAKFCSDEEFAKRFEKVNSQETDHSDAEDTRRADFARVTFQGPAHFTSACFAYEGDFRVVRFNERAGFSMATFTEKAKVNFVGARFSEEANFVKARLKNGGEFTSVTFEKGARFRGTTFGSRAVFNGTSFRGSTLFAPESVLFPKKGSEHVPIFSGAEVFFTQVTMEPPEEVIFRDADLTKCRFQGTDLRKVEITGAIWPEMDRPFPLVPKRIGVYDEKAPPGTGQTRAWLHIERVYRELKQNFEDRRDYERARDFHYGEKEMRRKNPTIGWGLWALLWLYWLVSGYSERALRPFLWGAALLGACTALYLWLGLCAKGGSEELGWTDLPKALEYSFRTMTLLKPDDLGLAPQGWARVVFLFESIAGPVLLGLFGLALRQRLKR
jgi:uncharacterized protein YjbI with pentapeptide repeats